MIAKAVCAAIVDDVLCRASLVDRARSGTVAPAVETMLWYYAKVRPKEMVEFSGRSRSGR